MRRVQETKSVTPCPGIEPGASAWQAEMLPTTPTRTASSEVRTRDLTLTKRMLCQLSYRGNRLLPTRIELATLGLWDPRAANCATGAVFRSESTLDRILIHRGVLAEKLFFSGDPRLFLESSIYKVSRTLKPKQIYILWQMYCVVKTYFKAVFKDLSFCHTAIITLFAIVTWVRLSQKHITPNTRYRLSSQGNVDLAYCGIIRLTTSFLARFKSTPIEEQ